jgi:hypothetical protein
MQIPLEVFLQEKIHHKFVVCATLEIMDIVILSFIEVTLIIWAMPVMFGFCGMSEFCGHGLYILALFLWLISGLVDLSEFLLLVRDWPNFAEKR